MRSRHFAPAAEILAVVAIGVVGMLGSPLQAQGIDQSQVQQGFAIAPVPLNLAGKNHDLVGLGSYLVNAIGDCNGCHSSGTPASLFIYPYVTGGNPYFGQPEKIDPSVYLNGGAVFPPVGTPTGPMGYAGPAMITRNLTPDKNGLPEGGHTLAEFKQIVRMGTDFDHVHPNCTAAQLTAIAGGATPACIPTGVIPGTMFDNIPNGGLLQIMPWVTFSHMTDRDIEAIYEYLSAIPCIDNTLVPGPAGDPDELRNDCGNGAVVPADAGVKGVKIQQSPRARQQH